MKHIAWLMDVLEQATISGIGTQSPPEASVLLLLCLAQLALLLLVQADVMLEHRCDVGRCVWWRHCTHRGC